MSTLNEPKKSKHNSARNARRCGRDLPPFRKSHVCIDGLPSARALATPVVVAISMPTTRGLIGHLCAVALISPPRVPRAQRLLHRDTCPYAPPRPPQLYC